MLVYLAAIALFSVVFLLSITYIHGDKIGGCGYALPSRFLLGALCCYSVAIPLSRVIFGTNSTGKDIPFLTVNGLAILGMVCGLWAGGFLRAQPCSGPTLKPRTGPLSGFLPIGVAILVAVVKFQELGWSVSGLLAPYGAEAGAIESSGLLKPLHVIASHLLIAVLVYRFALARLTNQRISAIVAIASVTCAFFLLRGSRNSFLMLLLPMLVIGLKDRIRPRQILVAAFAGYCFFSAVASARNVGYEDLQSVREVLVSNSEIFDPANGEFGTQFSVYDKWTLAGASGDLEFGKTYTIDLIANLVPNALWPSRPPTPAQRFSQNYFSTDILTEGLGYSPIVEGLQNFGIPGVPVAAMAVGFCLVGLERKLRKWHPASLAAFGFLFPFALNWNRIDFATNAKMYLLFLPVVLAAHLLSCRLGPSQDVHVVRRLVGRSA